MEAVTSVDAEENARAEEMLQRSRAGVMCNLTAALAGVRNPSLSFRALFYLRS
jgi:hypothetical protein